MTYVVIANPGVAPIEGMLLMGATSKSSEDEDVIGQFGSGIKYSVVQLLRNKKPPIVYLGSDRLEWFHKEITVAGMPHQEVFYKLNGQVPKTTNSVLSMGQIDWKDIWMAIREFASNALDAVGGQVNGIDIRWTETPRARAGWTQVYIPWGNDPKSRENFMEGLKLTFLHFRGPNAHKQYGAIPKLRPGTKPLFYRRGVLVRGWSSDEKSLWDYNFKDLPLDEARKANDWDLAYRAADLLVKYPEQFVATAKLLAQNPTVWEAERLNTYGLQTHGEAKTQLKAAMADWLGDELVVAATDAEEQLATKRGFSTVRLPAAWANVVDDYAPQSRAKRFGELAMSGKDELSFVPPAILNRVDYWTKKFKELKLTANLPDPVVKAFRQHPNAASRSLGYCHMGGEGRSGGYIAFDAEQDGEMLDQTVVEELCHWYSGATDATRGMQEFMLRAIVGVGTLQMLNSTKGE